MGRYYPPDSSSAPTFNTKHPLGSRARKLRSEGILTVRFEMPFAIWCSRCPKPTIIGQGVRFNAEKKKVGNYYSTPIWSFRMKHVVCGGEIEVRTDPKAGEYVVTEGAKRRDYGEDRVEEEGSIDEEERKKRREDAMAGLEGKKEEEVIRKEAGKRVEELREDRERWWSDPYEASRFVRKGFRRERKERHRERDKAEGIKDRLGLELNLVPENEEDKLRAGMVDFGQVRVEGALEASNKPLFALKGVEDDSTGKRSQIPMTKSSKLQQQKKQQFEQKLRSSTRAAIDPWGSSLGGGCRGSSVEASILGSIRRKQDGISLSDAAVAERSPQHTATTSNALVTYDSD
ncbi:hypothetical protein C1H76_2972 [Elsinoe australis]|uniref:Uncharacterized protein n=1 Tax=Elsinoe australis TaxID=40998 RepID=A0A4U7BAF9_9PEZI|nr:hypothetical protein C1H76_2972 [Elsinoe australis]